MSIYGFTLEKLSKANKQAIKAEKVMYIFAAGLADPISKKQGLEVYYGYSEKDYVTKRFAAPFLKDADYNIKFLQCNSK